VFIAEETMRHAAVSLFFLSLWLASEDEKKTAWIVGQDVGQQGLDAAKGFWLALSKADVAAAREHYADQVLVKAGSEMLKPQWGVQPAGKREQDALLDRHRLVLGYSQMIDIIGKAAWTKALSQARKVELGKAVKADAPFSGVQPGDLLLKVFTGPGDDTLTYVFREAHGRWRIVAEATDY
jgi:hypothetical protein